MTPQEQVAANVRARGYREGWTDEQFFARNVLKLLEEVAELADCVEWPDGPEVTELLAGLRLAAKRSRALFDRKPDDPIWTYITARLDEPLETPMKEAADVQVVLMNIADALGCMDGMMDFDVVQAAVEKSEADVRRGVREG